LPTAMPIFDDDGSPSGVLVAIVRADAFRDRDPLPETDPPTTSVVVDRGGTMISRRPAHDGAVGGVVPAPLFTECLRALDAQAPVRAEGIDRVVRTYALATTPGLPDAPVVGVGIPVSVAAADGWRALAQGLALVAASAVVSVGIAWWAAQPLVFREYGPLLSAVRRFAAGDLAARSGLEGKDGELAEIGRAFDEGAARIDVLTRERDGIQRRLQALARSLQRVRDEEQARLAREIHDEFGQTLTALRIRLQSARAAAAGDATACARADEALASVDDMYALLRRVASELRPPLLDQLGPAEAVRWHLARLGTETPLRVIADEVAEVEGVDRDVALAAFRILQEAMTNVVRHSGARTARVRLAAEGADLVLEVEDDGRGFDVAQADRGPSLGILGMRERAAALAGALEVRSAPGRGARLRLRLPRRKEDR
jgi:signal transduction histidine kinase